MLKLVVIGAPVAPVKVTLEVVGLLAAVPTFPISTVKPAGSNRQKNPFSSASGRRSASPVSSLVSSTRIGGPLGACAPSLGTADASLTSGDAT